MSRSKWGLASVLVVLLVAVLGTAEAKKPEPPPPPPTITAIAVGAYGGNPAMYAAATDGRIFVAHCGVWGCPDVPPFELAAQLPGRPVSMIWVTDQWSLLVCLENGDLYQASRPLPFTFILVENVFPPAGATPAQAPELAPQSGDRAPLGSLENALGRMSPNPSKGTATIEYATRTAGTVRVRIFDASGRLVRTLQAEHGTPGKHALTWDGSTDRGSRAPKGVYYYKATFPDGAETAKSLVRVE